MSAAKPPEELGRLREQGFDLDDTATLGPYDVEAMKRAVVARTGGGGGGGGGGLAWGAAAAAALLLFGLGAWALRSPVSVPASDGAARGSAPAQTSARAGLEDRAAAAVEAPTVAPAAAPAVVVARAAVDPARSGGGPRTLDPVPAQAPAEVPAGAVDDPDRELPPAPAATGAAEPDVSVGGSGDLDAQNAVFARGEAALSAGDGAAAGAAFHEYLQRWPAGVFRDDALVAVLDLLIRSNSWVEVEALAAQLGSISSLSSRQAQFARVRAEALVHLGRCEEALSVADGLERQASAAIRRSCR